MKNLVFFVKNDNINYIGRDFSLQSDLEKFWNLFQFESFQRIPDPKIFL